MRSRWVDRPMVFRMQTAAKAVVTGRDGTAPRNRKRYSIRLADLRWKSSLRSILFQATSITLNYSYRAPTIGQCVITRTIDTCCCCCCCYQFIPRIACGFPFFSCLLNVEWRGLFFLDAQLSGSEQKKKKKEWHIVIYSQLKWAVPDSDRWDSSRWTPAGSCAVGRQVHETPT